MKRFISLLLALVLINTFTVTGFAENGAKITASSAEYVLGDENKIVEITFSIDENPGFAAFDLIFTYDDSKLELKEIVTGSVLQGTIALPNPSENIISVMNLMDVSANGILFTAKYEVKDSVSVGKIDVSVEGKMYNSSGSEVAFTVVPGNVTIACKNHSFVKEVATEDYLATEATCTEPATYYYSCE